VFPLSHDGCADAPDAPSPCARATEVRLGGLTTAGFCTGLVAGVLGWRRTLLAGAMATFALLPDSMREVWTLSSMMPLQQPGGKFSPWKPCLEGVCVAADGAEPRQRLPEPEQRAGHCGPVPGLLEPSSSLVLRALTAGQALGR
jgi:hypothetical protein